ncbi:MAG TPA: hypothetical protein VHE83_11015 [Mycobacteriales bacterium]|nr:hypothetical protein [Mycobacteriales bacterium]
MSDWRERVSGAALHDFEVLMGSVLPSAESTLKRFGELQPFGASITADGDLVRLNADPRLGQNPQSRDVIRGIYTGARAAAFARRAIAVVQTGKSGGGSAMRIDMEHKDGTTVSVVVPFTISRFKKTYTRGTIMSGPGERRVWQDLPQTIDLRTPTEVTVTDVWSNEVIKHEV